MIETIQRNAKALIAALAPLLLAAVNIYQQVTDSGTVGTARWVMVGVLTVNALVVWAVPNSTPPVPVPVTSRYRAPEL